MSDHGAHFDVFTPAGRLAARRRRVRPGFGLQPSPTRTASTSTASRRAAASPSTASGGTSSAGRTCRSATAATSTRSSPAPTAHTGPHGTWFDVFSGGTQLRYVADGNSEYEGVVIDLGADHAVVERRDGKRDEIELVQILMWREGNATDINVDAQPDRPEPGIPEDAARGGAIASMNTESIPRSDAEAPSAHSATAAGGGDAHADRPAGGDVDDDAQGRRRRVRRRQAQGHRQGDRAGGRAAPLEPRAHQQRRLRQGEVPVVRREGAYDIGHQPYQGTKMPAREDVRLLPQLRLQAHLPAAEDQAPQAAPSKLAKTDDDELDVAKSVDSSETALQGTTGRPRARSGARTASTSAAATSTASARRAAAR
jgi:hypothetical protein